MCSSDLVGTPPLPQPPLKGAGPIGLAFTFAPPSLPPTPSGPAWLEGSSVGRGSGPGSQQAPRVPSGQGNLATLPFDPLPPRWSPSFPLLVWDPFPSLSRPSGAPVPPCLHFSSPLIPPHIIPSCWGFFPSPSVSMVPQQCLVGALVVGRRELCVLLVRHLDSASRM